MLPAKNRPEGMEIVALVSVARGAVPAATCTEPASAGVGPALCLGATESARLQPEETTTPRQTIERRRTPLDDHVSAVKDQFSAQETVEVRLLPGDGPVVTLERALAGAELRRVEHAAAADAR